MSSSAGTESTTADVGEITILSGELNERHSTTRLYFSLLSRALPPHSYIFSQNPISAQFRIRNVNIVMSKEIMDLFLSLPNFKRYSF